MSPAPVGATRFDRRKAHTRAALITAAQSFLAEGRPGVPIQDVTERADVGIGTFYNHFSSKDELFDAAIEDAIERYGALLDLIGSEVASPAAVFARSFRLTGRIHRIEPQISRVLLAQGHELSQSPRGIGPRARRDIAAATVSGQFTADDVDRAMIIVTGAMIELGHVLHDQPERDAAELVDAVTSDVLVALGMSRDEADTICTDPLPELPDLR
ncbi:TetR/AcrR family transcriptional regulator [Aeromicrobium sp. P5_D10]